MSAELTVQEKRNEVRLVAVMGQTGAGKSSFINSILGREVAPISNTIFSCTNIVDQFVYEPREGLTVALVDTPGFNYLGGDDTKTDEDIFQMIAEFLESKKLCPNNELSNTVVVTTHWDQVYFDQYKLQEAEENERLLRSDGYPKLFQDAGARFLRTGHFNNDVPQRLEIRYQSPAAVVESLLDLELNRLENHEVQNKTNRQTKTNLAQDIVQATLNQRMDSINKTVQDLRSEFSSRRKVQEDPQKPPTKIPEGQQDQSSTSVLSSELLEVQAKLNYQGPTPTHRDPKTSGLAIEFELLKQGLNGHMDSIRKSVERSQAQSSTQLKTWKDSQKSLMAMQREELRNVCSEVLKAKEMLQFLGTELKTELKTSRKERDELSIEQLTLRARERELLLSWKIQELQDENARLVQQFDATQSAQTKAAEAETRIMREAVIKSANLVRQLEERCRLEQEAQEASSLKKKLADRDSLILSLEAELKRKDDELARLQLAQTPVRRKESRNFPSTQNLGKGRD
ncbi:hypothetical protein EST38_g7374 [Candolleomyces aberdarensis]|uniref:G domain-containing protein n=1 Tax=Candolleomyces aberdarensis TaxID=2316362 RepID=A0A4V1Q3G2_9AGAR|nr:hypothetical protein EST38_g7374 [Candolleomyces aberdarensis]